MFDLGSRLINFGFSVKLKMSYFYVLMYKKWESTLDDTTKLPGKLTLTQILLNAISLSLTQLDIVYKIEIDAKKKWNF